MTNDFEQGFLLGWFASAHTIRRRAADGGEVSGRVLRTVSDFLLEHQTTNDFKAASYILAELFRRRGPAEARQAARDGVQL